MTLSHIDELKHLQDELQRRAFHDYLTGLPNRAMFMESLNTMIRKASKKTGSAFAILFIDLDRFKIINDELGHDVGDSLLQQVAQRLRSNIRQCDFVSRLGGDEFVVVLDESPDRTVIIFTAKAIIDAVADDYLIGSHRVNVTTSIGISRFPDDGTECSTLMKNADVAMYRAKERGRNDFQIYGELR